MKNPNTKLNKQLREHLSKIGRDGGRATAKKIGKKGIADKIAKMNKARLSKKKVINI